MVSYRDKFFTNRDDKARYGRFFRSSSPVSRTSETVLNQRSQLLYVRKCSNCGPTVIDVCQILVELFESENACIDARMQA